MAGKKLKSRVILLLHALSLLQSRRRSCLCARPRTVRELQDERGRVLSWGELFFLAGDKKLEGLQPIRSSFEIFQASFIFGLSSRKERWMKNQKI